MLGDCNTINPHHDSSTHVRKLRSVLEGKVLISLDAQHNMEAIRVDGEDSLDNMIDLHNETYSHIFKQVTDFEVSENGKKLVVIKSCPNQTGGKFQLTSVELKQDNINEMTASLPDGWEYNTCLYSGGYSTVVALASQVEDQEDNGCIKKEGVGSVYQALQVDLNSGTSKLLEFKIHCTILAQSRSSEPADCVLFGCNGCVKKLNLDAKVVTDINILSSLSQPANQETDTIHLLASISLDNKLVIAAAVGNDIILYQDQSSVLKGHTGKVCIFNFPHIYSEISFCKGVCFGQT